MKLVLWLLMTTACRYEAPPAEVIANFGDAGAGLVRLGPPAASGGVYDIAPYPEGGVMFVSNQRVPFITVVEHETGAWLDAIDLRETGEQRFPEQRIHVLDGVLLATNETGTAILRYDADSFEPLTSILPFAPISAHLTWEDELWFATPEEVVQYRGQSKERSFPIETQATAMFVDGQYVALCSQYASELFLYSREGELLWSAESELEFISDVLVHEGRLYVSDRGSGEVQIWDDGEMTDSVVVGADVVSLTLHDDRILAVARLGSELPESGTWQGAPAIVTALDGALETQWTTETDKGARFLAWDGTVLWTAAEGAQRLLAIDPSDGSIALRSDPLAMTLDHLERIGARVYFSSHITDSYWWVDFGDASAGSIETCGWPSSSKAHGDALWLACQDHGELWQLDPETMEIITTLQPAETFRAACSDPTCEDAHVSVDMANDRGVLVYSDPHMPGLRWSDGRPPVTITPEDTTANNAQHMGVRPLGRALLVHEPFSQHTWRIDASGQEDLGTELGVSSTAFPLVGGGDSVWLGGNEVLTDAPRELVVR